MLYCKCTLTIVLYAVIMLTIVLKLGLQLLLRIARRLFIQRLKNVLLAKKTCALV